MRVLDVATGTGMAAQAALALVGRSGSVTATDVSPAMVEKAHTRLAGVRNVSVSVEDGQSLSFPDESFDAVICSLGRTCSGFRSHRPGALLQRPN